MQNIKLTLKSVKGLNKILATFGLIIKMNFEHKITDIKLRSSTVLGSNALYKCECGDYQMDMTNLTVSESKLYIQLLTEMSVRDRPTDHFHNQPTNINYRVLWLYDFFLLFVQQNDY